MHEEFTLYDNLSFLREGKTIEGYFIFGWKFLKVP